MDHEQEAINYTINKFRNFGIVVEESGIRAILDYMDEYYEELSDESGVTVLYYTRDDVVEHITATRPEIPSHVTQTVLDARQEYIDNLAMMGGDNHG